MLAVVYLRVSTNAQATDGYGLAAQLADCTRYATAQGMEIYAVRRDEGVSGAKPAHERPGLTDALSLLADADALVTARLDRLARALTTQEAILAEVWNTEAAMHTADAGEWKQDDPDDPMRTAMRQMAGIFAQLDRAMVIKRMKDGRSAKARAGGKASGSYPYGWNKQGPVPAEQDVLARVQGWRLDGLSWPEVATRLNADSLLNRSGTLWTSANIAKIMG
ncbi:recombinase family protein [Arthrobacter cheniae]|uniref:Recombinase family protein n=1 Tax=Arthrobacter cheniae TaxID=1258888 RepID=A0A3A5MCN6_9MICC|nr:recombinase family protein [Arthrobacter cheniae]